MHSPLPIIRFHFSVGISTWVGHVKVLGWEETQESAYSVTGRVYITVVGESNGIQPSQRNGSSRYIRFKRSSLMLENRG